RGVEGRLRLREALLHQQQVAELFVVAGRGIVADQRLQLTDAAAAARPFDRVADGGEVEAFDEEVRQRADEAEENDDEQPVRRRPSAGPVHDRGDLEEDAPTEEVSHGVIVPFCDTPFRAIRRTEMDDIERNNGAEDEDEQFEQMIIENNVLLHSLAGLLVRKGVLKQEEIEEEMDKLYDEIENFEEE